MYILCISENYSEIKTTVVMLCGALRSQQLSSCRVELDYSEINITVVVSCGAVKCLPVYRFSGVGFTFSGLFGLTIGFTHFIYNLQSTT